MVEFFAIHYMTLLPWASNYSGDDPALTEHFWGHPRSEHKIISISETIYVFCYILTSFDKTKYMFETARAVKIETSVVLSIVIIVAKLFYL